MTRRVVIGLAVAACVQAGAPPSALADEVIEARIVWRFDATSYTVDQGEPLLLRNSDVVSPGPHNVTSTDEEPNGRPRFASASIRGGQEAPVEGARALTTGSYPFICTVHPFMRATLEVTDRGAPVIDDAAAPELLVSIRRASLHAARFVGTVTSDEPADLTARLTARMRGRTVLLGSVSGRAVESGEAVDLAIRPSRPRRRELRRARRATLTLAVEARDAAGNVGTGLARRRIRR